jgi:hypothetical protein
MGVGTWVTPVRLSITTTPPPAEQTDRVARGDVINLGAGGVVSPSPRNNNNNNNNNNKR